MKKPIHVETESQVLARITELLIQRKTSQKQLVEQLGLKKEIYTAWKSGRSDSYLKYIDEIATILDTTPNYLLRKKIESTEVSPEMEGKTELVEIYRQFNFEQQGRLIDVARSIRNECGAEV